MKDITSFTKPSNISFYSIQKKRKLSNINGKLFSFAGQSGC
jgi:hypothetical protein